MATATATAMGRTAVGKRSSKSRILAMKSSRLCPKTWTWMRSKDVGAAAAGTKASKKSTAVQASRERDSKRVMKKPKGTLKEKKKAKKLQRAISDDDEEASAGHDSGSDSHDRGSGSGNDSDAAGAAAAAPAAIEDEEDGND